MARTDELRDGLGLLVARFRRPYLCGSLRGLGRHHGPRALRFTPKGVETCQVKSSQGNLGHVLWGQKSPHASQVITEKKTLKFFLYDSNEL